MTVDTKRMRETADLVGGDEWDKDGVELFCERAPAMLDEAADELDALRAERDSLRVHAGIPWCIDCGPNVRIEEDGYCSVCGSRATARRALDKLEPKKGKRR